MPRQLIWEAILLGAVACGGCVARFGFLPQAAADGPADAAVSEMRRDGAGGEEGGAGAAPQIREIQGQTCVAKGRSARLTVLAVDPAGGPLGFAWSSDHGTIEGSGAEVSFTPHVSAPDPCALSVLVEVTSAASGLEVSHEIPIAVRHPADLDGDGVVGQDDLGILQEEWGRSQPECCPDGAPPSLCRADLTDDCLVGGDDLDVVRSAGGIVGCACAAPIPVGSCSADSWCWLHPTPSGAALASVWGSGASEVLAVGEHGTALRFDGTSWRELRDMWIHQGSRSSEMLRDISGAGGKYVVVGGDGVVLEHDGTDWGAAPSVAGTALLSVAWCGDRQLAAAFDTLYERETPSAGWDAYDPGSVGWTAVWCNDNAHFYAASSAGLVLQRTGTAWAAIRSGAPALLAQAIWGAGADLVVAGVEDSAWSALERYNGVSWSRFEHQGLLFLTVWGAEGTIYAGGSRTTGGGAVLRLEGAAFTEVQDTPAGVTASWASGATDVHLVGEGGLRVRFDGSSWQRDGPLSLASLAGVWGAGASALVAVGGDDALHFDGTSWQRRTVPASPLRGVWGRGADALFAVGGRDIARFEGSGWSVAFSGPKQLFAVAGHLEPQGGAATVVAVGDALAVRREGGGWSAQAFEGVALRAAWCAGPTEIWAVGTAVRRFDGTTWSAANIESWGGDSTLTGISGTPAGELIAVDDAGAVHTRATNAQQWQKSTLDGAPLRAVWAGHDGRAVVVGDDGAIYCRHGTYWRPQQLLLPRDLRAVWGWGRRVVVAGEKGTVLVQPYLP